jgi:hypothetical protein
MAEHPLCPRCRHANPQENRFCGSCGAHLGTAGSDLVARREGNPTVMGHALPVKPGPVSKAVAVGLVTLAVRAGLSWLRYRSTAGNLSSAPSAREPDTAVSARLLGRRLEEVLIQELEGGQPGRVWAWRAVLSIVITEPTDRRS